PVDGVVVKRDIELGQTVAASFSSPTLFTIAQDLREIDIYANVDEADVGRLKAGQTVSFTVNAYPNRTFDGTVRMVRLGGQTVQNVVTYTAVIRVANRDTALLPGMTANLQIVTEERNDALRVPNAALRFKPVGAPAVAPAASPSRPLSAPDAAEGRRPGGGVRAMQAQRERLIAEVQPTPEQAAAIERIFEEARGSAPGREPGLGDDERRAAMRAFRGELQRKVAAVLDPERRARYEALLAEGRPGRTGRAENGAPARVFTPGGDGQPVAVSIRVGATDGSFTEVLTGDLTDGAAVIVGGGPKPPPAAAPESSPAQRPRGPRLF
ncbi:MAG: Macrolide-specific efflux protein MacA, partial [uncultured Microvirga sp.]